MDSFCTRFWYNHLSVVEHKLIVIFGKWGHFVSSKPLLVIISSLILASTMSIGI